MCLRSLSLSIMYTSSIQAIGLLVIDPEGAKKWLRFKVTSYRAARNLYYVTMARNRKLLFSYLYFEDGSSVGWKPT